MPITANTPSQDGITISRSIQRFMFSLSKSAQSATQSDGSHHMWEQNYYLSLVLCEQDLAGVNVGSPLLFLSHADSQISASRSSRRVLCARCATG